MVNLVKNLLLLLVSIFLIILLSCTNQEHQQKSISTSSLSKKKPTISLIEKQQSLSQIITDELPGFEAFTKQVFFLKAIQQSPNKKIILFAPSNEAIQPHLQTVKENQEKLALVKNTVLLHQNTFGTWNGTGTTYGGISIQLSDDESQVIFNGKHAKILQKVKSVDGHLIYILDRLLA